METRRWKLLHVSAKQATKESLPSPYKDRFRSSREKQNLSRGKQIYKDSSNKLLGYVNSYLEAKSSCSKEKTKQNIRFFLPWKQVTSRQSISSEYFQGCLMTRVSFDPLQSQPVPTKCYPSRLQSIDRGSKCKTEFSLASTQRDSINFATPQINLIKQNSMKVGSKIIQKTVKRPKEIEQHYLNN